MSNAYHYQNTFDDELAQEFRKILSLGFSPPNIDGLQIWLDGSDLSTITIDAGNRVSQWDDKSGFDHHAVQGILTDQPIHGQESLNSLNGIFFDYPAKHIMVSSYTPLADDSLTVFVVIRRVDAITAYGGGSVYKSLLSSGRPDSSTTETGKFNIAENRDTAQVQTVAHKVNAYNAPSGTMTDGNAHIITSRLDYTNHLLGRADGKEEEFDSSTQPVANEMLPFEIGGSSSASTRRFWGSIFELLIYDRALPDEEILTVEAYLAQKWGLSL